MQLKSTALGSESGVTNDWQSSVPHGTVPVIGLLSRGTRDFIPRNDTGLRRGFVVKGIISNLERQNQKEFIMLNTYKLL